jgi:hypothetical protein
MHAQILKTDWATVQINDDDDDWKNKAIISRDIKVPSPLLLKARTEKAHALMRFNTYFSERK